MGGGPAAAQCRPRLERTRPIGGQGQLEGLAPVHIRRAATRLRPPDIAAQRRQVAEQFAAVGGDVPGMLAELPRLDDFFLDSMSQVRMKGQYTTGRVALVGDSAYGNTLGGVGTGLAVVGAYVLAGQLAVADGNHTVAYARYNEIMRRYAKIAGQSNAGRFLAPRTSLGIRARTGSSARGPSG
jgi:2-polyprenyl-6-methoxyphenol hydroxylase-like FAD-dependent oxidoreductase